MNDIIDILMLGGASKEELMPNPRNRMQKELGALLGGDADRGKWLEKGIYALTLEEMERNAIQCEWNDGPFLALYTFKVDEFREYFKTNPAFVKKVKAMKLADVHNIPYQNVEALFPDIWTPIIEKHLGEKSMENFVEYTDAFKCEKCGSKKCVTTAPQQTRSMDEGMTVDIICQNCGNKWVQ